MDFASQVKTQLRSYVNYHPRLIVKFSARWKHTTASSNKLNPSLNRSVYQALLGHLDWSYITSISFLDLVDDA